jgi:hypothetical protein
MIVRVERLADRRSGLGFDKLRQDTAAIALLAETCGGMTAHDDQDGPAMRAC